MKKFNAKRGGSAKLFLLVAGMLPIIIFFVSRKQVLENPSVILVSLIPLGILIWVYYGTYYTVENNTLFYRSAFIKGEIDINQIHEIVKGKTTWVGIKPATATKGLLLKYNTHDEIYISPENNDELIDLLITINTKINIS